MDVCGGTLYAEAAVVRGRGRGVAAPLLSPAESLASGRELLREVRGMGLGGELPPDTGLSNPPEDEASSLLPVECS